MYIQLDILSNKQKNTYKRYLKSCNEVNGCLIHSATFPTNVPKRKVFLMKNPQLELHPKKDIIKTTCKNVSCISIDHLYHTTVSAERTLTDTQKFESIRADCKEDSNGCWLWTKMTDRDKYGQIKHNNKTMRTHRLMYEIHHGIQLASNQLIRHGPMCKRHCCNPEHLDIGTDVDNYLDRVRDGTAFLGENGHKATISNDLAEKIKLSKWPDGHPNYLTMDEIAKKYNVNFHIVNSIFSGASWDSIPGNEGVSYGDHANVRLITQKRIKNNKKNLFDSPLEEEAKNEILSKLKRTSMTTEKDCTTEDERNIVREKGCWLSNASRKKKSDDYRELGILGIKMKVHQWAAFVHYGHGPPDKQICTHQCNVKRCCNPNHIVYGTVKKNQIDIVKDNLNNKLCPYLDNVKEMLDKNMNMKDIATAITKLMPEGESVQYKSISDFKNKTSFKWWWDKQDKIRMDEQEKLK